MAKDLAVKQGIRLVREYLQLRGPIVEMGHWVSFGVHASGKRLVSALTGGRHELARALVTQEVVTREDVVHLETLGAREALADVALEQRGVANELAAPLVGERAGRGRPPARLAAGGRFHGRRSLAPGGNPLAPRGVQLVGRAYRARYTDRLPPDVTG
jgi:hypothetical protein